MSLKQVAWFVSAHAALVAAAIGFDLAVLCQGDAKYDGGCGGFGLYIPLWAVFPVPLPVAAILLEQWRRASRPPGRRLFGYLATGVLIAGLGFVMIDKFPVLLAVEATAIAIFGLVRWRAVRARYPDLWRQA